jgi:hypothetical protein
MKLTSLLRLLLVLVGIHSFIVGIMLIFFPASLMGCFGYENINEPFFMRQGGVFHLVLVVAYLMAAYYYFDQSALIILSIIAKVIATIFLFSYYFFISDIWMVLVSGFGDAVMAILIYILYKTEKNKIIS